MYDRYVTIGRGAERVFGLFLFAIGLVCALYGWRYGLGRLNDIGPGAFPLGLGAALTVLALLCMAEAGQDGPVSRRLAPLVFYLPAIIIWALLIDWAGLLVSTLVLTGLCALAEEKLNMTGAIALGLALTAVGYVVFILGFGLSFDLVGFGL